VSRLLLALVFSIKENLNQDGTVNFKGYAVVTDQQSPRQRAKVDW